jgi:hypothetical protein
MPSVVLWTELDELAVKAAKLFGFRPPILVPTHRRYRCKRDGFATNGRQPVIELRVHRYHRPRQALKRSAIMATFAHELAHLAPGCWEHGAAHCAKTREIATWLIEQGQPVWIGCLNFGSYYTGTRRRQKRRKNGRNNGR